MNWIKVEMEYYVVLFNWNTFDVFWKKIKNLDIRKKIEKYSSIL
jgi:hypothetical protein